jgi:hypothetical protein
MRQVLVTVSPGETNVPSGRFKSVTYAESGVQGSAVAVAVEVGKSVGDSVSVAVGAKGGGVSVDVGAGGIGVSVGVVGPQLMATTSARMDVRKMRVLVFILESLRSDSSPAIIATACQTANS